MKRIFILTFLATGLLMCKTQPNLKVVTGVAEVNGTKLYYETVGIGEVIVLVHGNEGDRRHWDYQFQSLAKDFKVIRYDVRGYGNSALPDTATAYWDHEDLKALLDHLEVGKAHICGLSMGSSIAVDFALAYPDMCHSLIPIGPWANGYGFGEYQTPASDSLFSIMGSVSSIAKEQGPKAATDYFWTGNKMFSNTVISQKALEHLLLIGYDYSFWGFINPSQRMPYQPLAITQLSEIQIPTLIVTAEYDLEPCLEIAKIMQNEIPNSKLVSMGNAGHCMNIEKPEEFNVLLVEFINEIK